MYYLTLMHILAHTLLRICTGEAQGLIQLWEELTFPLKIHLCFLSLDL